MGAYLNRPDWFFGLAANADPNDPTAVPVWTDFTAALRSSGPVGRGAQYEMATALASDPEIVLRDRDETLNPENAASALYGGILPYREVLWLGMWPNIGSSTASAGNLLNANTWRVPYDCSLESYAAGATVPWITAVGGTAPVVDTATPHAGTKDLSYAVVNGATVQGVSWQLPCIPGRQYTVSAYLRQSSASTQGIYVDASVGSTTTTTGAYVRLTKTFTATQPYHTAYVQTSGTAVAGTVLVDDVQHEQGASATTATTTGSVIYPVLRNYVEDYKRAWMSNGFEGIVTMPCVDAQAALAAITIGTEYAEALAATAPDYSWSLGDGTETAAYAGANTTQPALVAFNSKFGAGSISPGATVDIPGDPGQNGVEFTASTGSGGTGQAMTALGYGHQVNNARDFTFPASLASPWSASVACWVVTGAFNTADQTLVIPWYATLTNVVAPISLGIITSNKHAYAELFNPATANCTANGTTALNDGLPHLLVATITQTSGANTVLTLYVDGVAQATTTVTTASLGGMLPFAADTIDVGAWMSAQSTWCDNSSGATISRVSLWNRALSAAEVTSLWTAGGLAFAGETSGARVLRHLALGGYAGVPARVSAGSTTMGPPTWSPTIDLWTDTTDNATAEMGHAWLAPDGAPVFEGRQDRWLRLTPAWTLGENAAGGEIPYEGDIGFGYDGFFVYADVTVARNNGTTATGGLPADITTAGKRFFGRAYDQNSDFATDQQAQDAANFIFYTHNRPATRVGQVVVRPSANPTLWPFALSVEIGQRVRVLRRPKAANAGAGITMTLDFFVENITHDQIDMDTGEWVTQLWLSPIGSVASQTGLSAQPWILDNTTYSVLDSTTILGW
jgi:Concanavalin A-like lectin/glucanases superfamily